MNDSSNSSDPRARTVWALRRAELAVQGLKERQLRPVGITASHYALLVSIDSEPGLAGATLARRLNITPQAIASLVARLVERGFIERRPHPRHPNVRELHLTDEGRRSLSRADDVVQRIEQRVEDLLGTVQADELRVMLDAIAFSLAHADDGQAEPS
ncbi:DNA-binding MarR family transcriptional regulator [Microbacterium natoriense]|uniref:DNA-binding MarR family transcriptional regulator n=1 Tax=Microbacterium natoriense TaxID=284570 RepID=A0AAW8EUU4_9MICO|nr:MarR family transcriptional regulator [Microbacterium natoriense]MDQ0647062.1 DNA-binding MarR family transcriptional regulator [Microbacterium natoriense]